MAGGLTVGNFTAHVALDKGVLRVDPAKASIYGGTLGATVQARLERSGPPFDTSVKLSGTQVADLLAGLSPKLKETATGTLDLTLDAKGAGGDLTALTSKVQAEAKDGKILNQPLVQKFADLFQVKELQTLNFYSTKADLETAGGVGTLQSFILNGPDLQATGKGTIGLVSRDLDLQLAVALPRKIAGKLIRDPNVLDAVTDPQGWTRLPLRLKGTVDDPSYGLDTEALSEVAAKALGGKAKKALEEKLLKKVLPGSSGKEGEKNLLPEGIKKLFGN